jgi:hypothetical protein
MNTHLRSDEFVDALDGTLGAERLEHLVSCASCRDELTGVQALMSEVKTAGTVPEPSPLFWDHFSARVRQATADVPAARRTAWWQSAWRPLAGLAAGAAVVAVVTVTISRPDAEPGPAQQASLNPAPVDALTDETESSSLAFMSAAASDLSWEEARAVDLAPAARAVDSAIDRLSAAQRAELVKLIREDLRSME